MYSWIIPRWARPTCLRLNCSFTALRRFRRAVCSRASNASDPCSLNFTVKRNVIRSPFCASQTTVETPRSSLFRADFRSKGARSRFSTTPNREVAVGDPGEICVRSPYVMAEYWKRPEQTASTLRNGWLHTDDIARADDRGYMFILDRKKDMIVSGGFNIYPRDVED